MYTLDGTRGRELEDKENKIKKSENNKVYQKYTQQ